MGILRLGEKRGKSNIGYTKVLKVNRIGWKRIAKNTTRFGWNYVDVNKGSNLNLSPQRIGKRKVVFSFYRLDTEKDAQPTAVRTLEFIYNLIFLFRRIAAFFLPILIAVGIIVSIIKQPDGFFTALAFIFSDFAIWIACIILEGVLARSAEAKLKANTNVTQTKSKQQIKSSKNNSKCSSSDQEDDDIITLTTAKGEDLDFEQLAGIAYHGNFYAIMKPLKLLDSMDEDEALVFRVFKTSEGEDKFEVELDDDIIDAVFVEYNNLLDEAEKNDWKSST